MNINRFRSCHRQPIPWRRVIRSWWMRQKLERDMQQHFANVGSTTIIMLKYPNHQIHLIQVVVVLVVLVSQVANQV